MAKKRVTLRSKGFPGWHIECTAMGCHYLGERFDIHTGGIDHIPIHHTNEIAQAEGAFGHDHVRYWLHNEFLVTDKEKMAKSAGNFLRLQTLLEKGYDALDYRYFCLLTHYRKPIAFSWEAIDAAATARRRLTDRVIELKGSPERLAGAPSEAMLALQGRFAEAIADDLNTPQALAVVHEMLRSDLPNAEKLSLVLDWDQVLGLRLKQAERTEEETPADVQALVDARQQARKAKDWAASDRIRDEIRGMGWQVSDTPDGQRLERV